MTREELLEYHFGRSDFRPPTRELYRHDEQTGAILAWLDLYYRRVLVMPPTGPAGISVAATTLVVAELAHLCVDPDHEGEGHARALVEQAHEVAATHAGVDFAAAVAVSEDVQPFFEKLGYSHPPSSPAGFLVRPLPPVWPAGLVQLP